MYQRLLRQPLHGGIEVLKGADQQIGRNKESTRGRGTPGLNYLVDNRMKSLPGDLFQPWPHVTFCPGTLLLAQLRLNSRSVLPEQTSGKY